MADSSINSKKMTDPTVLCKSLPKGSYIGEYKIAVTLPEEMDVNGDGINDNTYLEVSGPMLCNENPPQDFRALFNLTPEKNTPLGATNEAGITFSVGDVVMFNEKEYTLLSVLPSQELILNKKNQPKRDSLLVTLVSHQDLFKVLDTLEKPSDYPRASQELRSKLTVTRLGELTKKSAAILDSKKAVIVFYRFMNDQKKLVLERIAKLSENLFFSEALMGKLPVNESSLPDITLSSAARPSCSFRNEGEATSMMISARKIINFDIDGDKKDDLFLEVDKTELVCTKDNKKPPENKTSRFLKMIEVPKKILTSSGTTLTMGEIVEFQKKQYVLVGVNFQTPIEVDAKGNPIREKFKMVLLDASVLGNLRKLFNENPNLDKLQDILKSSAQQANLEDLIFVNRSLSMQCAPLYEILNSESYMALLSSLAEILNSKKI